MKRRLGASVLTLALIAVIAAAVVPSCADSLCCAALPGPRTVSPEMPCCEPTLTARNSELQPARVVEDRQSCLSGPGEGQAGLPVLHVARIESPPPVHPHPSAPLFLRNEQFRI
jgi:hypothetical protein